jgi:hypothetical protein
VNVDGETPEFVAAEGEESEDRFSVRDEAIKRNSAGRIELCKGPARRCRACQWWFQHMQKSTSPGLDGECSALVKQAS